MSILNKNYTYDDYKKDLEQLKQYWEELSTNQIEPSVFREKFFISYNNVYSFCLYSFCKNIYSVNELTFQPFVFNRQHLRGRKHEDLVGFKKDSLGYLLDGYLMLNKIWFKYSISKEYFFLIDDFEAIFYELQEKRLTFANLKNDQTNERDYQLRFLRGIYNGCLFDFLELIQARYVFLEILNKINGFWNFPMNLIRVIITMDRYLFQVIFELIAFAEEYSKKV